jgi:hypothetical protein
VTARLARLEEALAAMKPKIEAIIANQTVVQASTAAAHSNPPPVVVNPPSTGQVTKQTNAQVTTQTNAVEEHSPSRTPRSGGGSPLRMRRNMPQLSVTSLIAKPQAAEGP